jgi:hypothetical protein
MERLGPLRPLVIDNLVEDRLRRKIDTFLKGRNLRVEVINKPKNHGLILINHPTSWDPLFFRLIPQTFSLIYGEGLRKTGVKRLDSILATEISHMIPVYRGNQDWNRKAYRRAADLLDRDYNLVLAPTGKVACSNEIPTEEEIRPGGTIRILQQAQNRVVIPALIFIDGQILRDGSIETGGRIVLSFSESPLDLKGLNLNSEKVEDKLLRSRIVDAWKQIKQNLALEE